MRGEGADAGVAGPHRVVADGVPQHLRLLRAGSSLKLHLVDGTSFTHTACYDVSGLLVSIQRLGVPQTAIVDMPLTKQREAGCGEAEKACRVLNGPKSHLQHAVSNVHGRPEHDVPAITPTLLLTVLYRLLRKRVWARQSLAKFADDAVTVQQPVSRSLPALTQTERRPPCAARR